MSDVTIYHNGECSKSGGVLEILQSRGIPHNVRWYIMEPLTEHELRDILRKLGMKASELVRTNEVLYKEQYEGRDISEDEWMRILIDNPELMQRPIIVNGDRAILARPPERALEIL